ncbi:MAG TPA: ABC transporter substrate-binding protein [Chloroflexota bacterium]
MNPARRSVSRRLALGLALVGACLALTGCALPGRTAAEPPTPTEAVPPPTAPTPRERAPRPPPTAIPPPTVLGRAAPPPSPTPGGGARTRLSLALDGPPWAAQAGLFMARERGFYLEAGIDVFFHVTPSRTVALSELARGRDELGLVGGDDLLRARAEGTPALSLLALDANAPDGYALVLATTEQVRAERVDALRSFVSATVRGYAEAARDPGAAAATLGRADSEIDRPRAERQIGELLPLWRAPGPPLRQDDARWSQAHHRLVELGQLPSTLDPRTAFTNELSIAVAPHPESTRTPPPTALPRPTVVPPPNRPTPRLAAPAPRTGPVTPGIRPTVPAPTPTPSPRAGGP